MARNYKAEYARRVQAARERGFDNEYQERKFRKQAAADLIAAGVYTKAEQNKKANVEARVLAALAYRDLTKDGKIAPKTHDRLKKRLGDKKYHDFMRRIYPKKGK